MEDNKRGMSSVWLWLVFFPLLAGLSVGIGQLVFFIGHKYELVSFFLLKRGAVISVAIFFLASLLTAVRAVKIVPQEYAWVTEVLGKFSAEWTAGPHMLFPWGGHVVRARFFMGPGRELHIHFKEKGDPDLGPLDFGNAGKVPARIVVLVVVLSARKAAYATVPGQYHGTVVRTIARWIRPIIESFSLEEAKTKGLEVSFLREKNPGAYDFLERIFALRVESIGATDFSPPEEIIEATNKVAAAKKEAEVAVHRAAAIETLAAADRAALEARGAGFAAQVAAVSGEGVDPQQAWEGLVKERVVGAASGNDGGGNDVAQTVIATAVGLAEAFKKGKE